MATLFEVFGSLIWGGYHYRCGNIPLYVPPGHALVYVFGITAGALPFVARHPDRFRRVVLALATVWTLAGVTVLPLTGHRLDLLGADAPGRSSPGASCARARPTMFAAIWIATATLEIAGTLAGDWTWVARRALEPPRGRQPALGDRRGYAVIDGSVALVAGRRSASPGGSPPPGARTRLAPAAPDRRCARTRSGTVRRPCPRRETDYLEAILNANVYDVAIETPLQDAPLLSERLGNRLLPEARGPAARLLVQAARRVQQDVPPLGGRAAARRRRRLGRATTPRASRSRRSGSAPRRRS